MPTSPMVAELLGRLTQFREEAGLSTGDLDERLIVGPGWTQRFESGEAVPALDVLLVILNTLGKTTNDLFNGIDFEGSAGSIERVLFAEEDGKDLLLRFAYADHDATYRLENAKMASFEVVLRALRDGLADEGQKTDAVVAAFEKAAKEWPDANPSDLWWFLVYRAYCDPFNHPASEARRNFDQSWKRTGGWALERILVRHYGPFLKTHGINLAIPKGQKKQDLLSQLAIPSRLEIDKVDVVLSGEAEDGAERCFGVVHVKASFAERRTDDVELSTALMNKGYTSPFWTMDCKSSPAAEPVNRGELGALLGEERDPRSAKRKDFEVDGYFSACFSYNQRTKPTPTDQKEQAARVFVCDFRDPNDEFSKFALEQWDRFKTRAD